MAAILFGNRQDAGAQLALKLEAYAGLKEAIVLALPRGGVPVGFAVAKALRLPLDILIVRKLGVPGHEEFAMGAIASGGIRVLTNEALRMFSIPPHMIDSIARRELDEIERREKLYRGGRVMPDLTNKTVIVVDDGLATGATMQAAVAVLRQKHPEQVIVAVPVAAPETCEKIGREVDRIICLHTPSPFYAVSPWYSDFTQTADSEVTDLLEQARQWLPSEPDMLDTRQKLHRSAGNSAGDDAARQG